MWVLYLHLGAGRVENVREALEKQHPVDALVEPSVLKICPAGDG